MQPTFAKILLGYFNEKLRPINPMYYPLIYKNINGIIAYIREI